MIFRIYVVFNSFQKKVSCQWLFLPLFTAGAGCLKVVFYGSPKTTFGSAILLETKQLSMENGLCIWQPFDQFGYRFQLLF